MKAAGKPTDAITPESEDIAKLLRALNEDLKADPIDDVADLDEDEEEPQASRGLPLGKIAAALVAAAGIGFAVVMLDPTGSTPTEPATASTNAGPLIPAPAITRAPAPAAGQTPPSAPESMIARAPAVATAPASPPASVAPAPPPPVAAPLNPPPALKVPEPPALPPTAAAVPTRPVVVAKPPEAPVAPAPRAEAPKPAPVPVVPAAPPVAATPKAAETGDLQAMLAPPKDARDVKRLPAKPADSTPATAKPASVTPEAAVAATPPGGRYTVQVGSFSVVENADALARRLQGNGFTAYTVDWTDGAAKSWRAVRVGGYADPAAAKRAAGELKARMNLNTVVVPTR